MSCLLHCHIQIIPLLWNFTVIMKFYPNLMVYRLDRRHFVFFNTNFAHIFWSLVFKSFEIFWQGKNHIYWEKWSLAAILFIFFYLYLLSLSIYFYEQKVLQGVGKFPVPSLVISMEYGFRARGLIWARISQLFFTINKKTLFIFASHGLFNFEFHIQTKCLNNLVNRIMVI